MKYWILVGMLLVSFVAFAQDSLVVEQDSMEIELMFDSLPLFTFFDPSLVEKHQSRIASIQGADNTQSIYFWIIMLFSVIFTWVFLNSRELVKSSVKSIQSFQHTIHFSRTDKQSNIFYFIWYALLFLLGLSLVSYYVSYEIFQRDTGLLSITLVIFTIFILDYLFTYLYLLFASSNRSVELVQAVVLNYAIILCLVLSPALFFIVLTGLAVAKFFSIVLVSIIGIILVIKEIRVLQVLWSEKINIFSIDFFAYLCTFKFLPIILLIRIALQ